MVDIISYFNNRLLGIIAFKDLIKGITIHVFHAEIYGKEFFRIYYHIDFDEVKLENLPPSSFTKFNNHFACDISQSGFEFVSFEISDEFNKEERAKNIKAFYDCYSTLTLSLVEFCHHFFGAKFPIRIQDLNGIPEVAYTHQFWLDSELPIWRFYHEFGINLNDAIRQHAGLVQLCLKSLIVYQKYPEKFFITDQFLKEKALCTIKEIRNFLNDHQVPVYSANLYVIRELKIDVESLLNILKNNSESKEILFKYSIDSKQIIDVVKLTQNKHYKLKKKFHKKSGGISDGDLLLLNDEAMLVVDDIIDKGDELQLNGFLMKKDLSIGKIKRKCDLNEIKAHLSKAEYEELQGKYQWALSERLVRWLKQNKCKKREE